jgi:hypothetical protein
MDRPLYGPPGRASNGDLAAVARKWVTASCARQGVPVQIEDPRVLAGVGSLLGYERGEPVAVKERAGKRQTRQSGVTRAGSKRLSPR